MCVKFSIDHMANTGLAEEYEQIENFGPNFSHLSNNCCEKYQAKTKKHVIHVCMKIEGAI